MGACHGIDPCFVESQPAPITRARLASCVDHTPLVESAGTQVTPGRSRRHPGTGGLHIQALRHPNGDVSKMPLRTIVRPCMHGLPTDTHGTSHRVPQHTPPHAAYSMEGPPPPLAHARTAHAPASGPARPGAWLRPAAGSPQAPRAPGAAARPPGRTSRAAPLGPGCHRWVRAGRLRTRRPPAGG